MSTVSSGGRLGGRIVALFAPYRGRIALVFAVIVLSSGLSVVGALLVKVVFDKALFPPGGPDLPLLFVLVGALIAIPIVTGLLNIVQTYYTNWIGNRVLRDLRDRLFGIWSGCRWRSSPRPAPARCSPGWPTTWAVCRRPSPPRRRRS